MRQEGLESFIRKNKGSFDKSDWDKEGLWKKLETELTHQPKESRIVVMFKQNWWPRAVAAVLIVSIAMWLFSRQNTSVAQVEEVCGIKGVPATFCSQVVGYEKTFQEKVKLLDKNELKQMEIPETVINEITLSHHEQKELINELKSNPQNKMVQEALIEYYQAKIKLLDRLKKSIDLNKKYKDEKNYNDISI